MNEKNNITINERMNVRMNSTKSKVSWINKLPDNTKYIVSLKNSELM